MQRDQQVELDIETPDAYLTFPSPSVSTASLPTGGGQGPHGEPGGTTTSAIVPKCDGKSTWSLLTPILEPPAICSRL